MRYRIIFLLALLLALAVALPAAGYAQSSTPQPASRAAAISLRVQPHFGGHYKYGEWLPLRVAVTNNGPDVSAELRASITGGGATTTYAAPAPLPSGAQKEIELDVLLPSFARNVTVDLVQDGHLLQSAQVDVFALRNITYLVGLIAPEVEAYSTIEGVEMRGAGRTVKRAAFPLRDLPERALLMRSFDALIIADTDTQSLSPGQAEALRQWVLAGGRLVVAGGPGAERTLAGLPPGLAPAAVSRATRRGVAALSGYAAAPAGALNEEFAAAFPAAPFGRTVVAQDGQPLIAEQHAGQGWIDYLAFDPALSPFSAWTGMRAVWLKLFEPGATYPQGLPPDMSAGQMAAQRLAYVLTNMPSLELPSVRWLALLLAVYVILIGPANYLVLSRLRRLDWAWASIPLLTVVFAASAFGVGYGLRGNDVILNEITVVQKLDSDGPALIRSYVGVFSPARNSYSFRVHDDALLSPLIGEPNRFGGPFQPTTLTVVEGRPAMLRDLSINQWAMQSFQAERYAPPAEWDVSASIDYRGTRVEGTLRNGTPYDLTDVVLVAGSRFARLGNVAAGAEMKIGAELRGAEPGGPAFPYALFDEQIRAAGPSGPSRSIMIKQNMLESNVMKDGSAPSMPSALTIIGWFSASPNTVELVGGEAGHQYTSLLMVGLPLTLQGREVTLVPGIMTGRIVEFGSEAGPCGMAGRAYVANGSATLQYDLPRDLVDATVTKLTLVTAPEGGPPNMSYPKAELYDWPANKWVTQPALKTGENVIAEPARFVHSGDGVIRLKLTNNSRDAACALYDLGLEAKRE